MEGKNTMVHLHTNHNLHFLGCLWLLLLFPTLPVMADTTKEILDQFTLACAIVINEKEPTDTLIFQLEAGMVISVLCESENNRKMSEEEMFESLDNLKPFVVDENTFLKLKNSSSWIVKPSSYLDSIYSVDGINGVIEECFFPVEGILYMKYQLNKEGLPVVWTDFIWEKYPGDYYFNVDDKYIIFLLQKHHLYTKYTPFINIILISNVDVVVVPINYELR